MKNTTCLNINKEGLSLLLEDSLIAMPFNFLLALLLAWDLFHNGLSPLLVGMWFLCISIISVSRWIYSKQAIQTQAYYKKIQPVLRWFILLTLLMGITWGSGYVIFSPYISQVHELFILLVFGGMCAGSIASLSVYLPAYYAYILPMLLPVIVCNYVQNNVDRGILATAILLFIIMVTVLAKQNGKMTRKTLELATQKERLINKLEAMSITDSLTGLYNRRYFEIIFQKEYNRAKRNTYPLSLISIDIDNFKTVNDTFGHASGDKFLIYSAELFKNTFLRSSDTVFRLGGDEFAVIIANMPMNDVIFLCEMLRKKYKDISLQFKNIKADEQNVLATITLSIGIAYIHSKYSSDIDSVVLTADEALYKAKEQGKNKIVLVELK